LRVLLAAGLALAAVGIAAASVSGATRTDRKQNKAIKALKADTAELQDTIDGITSALDQLAGDFATHVSSAEYGVIRLYFDAEGNGFEADDAVPNQTLTSADIPDTGDQAIVSGTLRLTVPDGTTAKPIALKAGIRSGETDGGADPTGQAGLAAMTAQIVGAPGTTSIGGGNPGTGGTLPLSSSPNATYGGMPLYDIPGKDTPGTNPLLFPDSEMIELTNPANLETQTGAPARFSVTNTSGGPAAAIFDVTVRFTDVANSNGSN
jgi:hypothetical protein